MPISVSVSSNLEEDPMFRCKVDPRALVSSSIDSLKYHTTHSKTQMKTKFLQVETTIRSKVSQILKNLFQRRTHRIDIEGVCIEDDSDNYITPTNGLPDHFERHCDTSPVCAVQSFNSIKAFLLPILNNQGGVAPIVLRKTFHFVSFKFVND